MTTITIISRVTQALVLSTGFVAAGASEGCPDAAGAVNGVAPSSAAQAPTPGGLSPAELHAVLNDVALNKKDGLDNYGDDYRVRYPK